jgi:uncharacterized repeat protein (TIGR02543 family)
MVFTGYSVTCKSKNFSKGKMMKNILLVLLLCSLGYSATKTYTAGAYPDSNASNGDNWNTGAPGTGDLALLPSAAGHGINWNIPRVGNIISQLPYPFLCTINCTTDAATGRDSLGGAKVKITNEWHHQGTGIFYIRSTLCSLRTLNLYLDQSCSLSFSQTILDSLHGASGKYIAWTGGTIGNLYLHGGILIPKYAGAAIYPSAGYVFDAEGGYINGTSGSSITASEANGKITINNLKNVSSPFSIIDGVASGLADTILFTGTVFDTNAAASENISVYRSGTVKSFFIFNNIFLKTVKRAFRFGNNSADPDSAKFEMNGSTMFLRGGFQSTTYNAGKSILSFVGAPACTIRTVLAIGSNTTIIPDQWKILIDSTCLITTAGKQFYDLYVKNGYHSVDSFADSGNFNIVSLDSGKFKGISNGGHARKLRIGGTQTDSIWGRLGSRWWAIDDTLIIDGKMKNACRILDSTRFVATSKMTYIRDSVSRFNAIKLPYGDGKLTVVSNTAGIVDTLVNSQSGAFSGTSSDHRDTIIGAVFYHTAALKDTFAYYKNCTFTGGGRTVYFGFDGGGNTGITFNGTCPSLSYVQNIYSVVDSALSITPSIALSTFDSFEIYPSISHGISFNKSTGVISGIPDTSMAKTEFLITGLKTGCSDLIAPCTLQVIWGSLVIDSISPDTINLGGSGHIYGRGFGPEQDTSTLITDDGDTMNVVGWINTQIDFIAPMTMGTGKFVDMTFSIGEQTEIVNNAFYVGATTLTYSVTYDGNGNNSGTVPTDATLYEAGATVTVKANTGTLAKTGSTFVGWNTAADGTGTSYAASAPLTMGSANITLFAKWTTNPTYSVTYDDNGSTSGTVPMDVNNYLQNAAVTVLGNTGSLSKTGFAFGGWNTAADGSGTARAVGSTFAMESANVILYAKWIRQFSFIPSTQTGGTIFPATDQTGDSGVVIALSSASATGYHIAAPKFTVTAGTGYFNADSTLCTLWADVSVRANFTINAPSFSYPTTWTISRNKSYTLTSSITGGAATYSIDVSHAWLGFNTTTGVFTYTANAADTADTGSYREIVTGTNTSGNYYDTLTVKLVLQKQEEGPVSTNWPGVVIIGIGVGVGFGFRRKITSIFKK